MKLLIILSLLSLEAVAKDPCMFQLVEQNGMFYAIRNNPNEPILDNEKIKTKLEVGNMDVDLIEKKVDPINGPDPKFKPRQTQIKVRFESQKREEVEDYINSRCN